MKNSIKVSFILVSFLCFLIPVSPHAKDTDLYMASGEGVEPNILIIFDNSGSMNDEVATRYYDPAVTYDPLVVSITYRDTVYYRRSGGGWSLFANNISLVACPAARTALTNYGHYEGNTNSSCNSSNRTLQTGNYRNYVASGGDQSETKLSIAKGVITDFLNTINGVRIGMMVFNKAVTDNTSEGGSSRSNSHGGHIQSTIKSLTDANRTQLKNDVNAIVAETWTPLAETLYEAGLYFKGGASYYNSGVTYISPIQYYCQRNYIVLITDGDSTRDQGKRGNSSENSILKTAIGDRDGDGYEPGGAHEVHYIVDGEDMLGTDYLDDVAKYLYDTDLRTDLTGQQNITTYTIGFTYASQHELLNRAAALGHGRYFYTENAQQLSDAFQNIIGEILEKTSSFVAPIVPVSRMERTTAGDKIYLALFQPKKDTMWSGNIKKFGVVQSGDNIGQIIDANGLPALDDRGQILATARSYWTTISMDGSDVEKGGVGEILMNRDFSTNPRKIYTYLGSNTNLTHSSNTFNTTNITPTMLGLSSGDTTGRNKLVQFVLGYDAYDDNGNGNTSEKKDWVLGAFIHSRPQVIHYESQSVIFAGSNDGMLHAFDDDTGEELWAFIPPNLLNKLQALHEDVLESFVDGSPRVYISFNEDSTINQAILILSERRGGNHYYALNVTNPNAPQYLWKISPEITGFSELGQTWSAPTIGKVTIGAVDKYVAFIGGGYDENQDNDPLTTSDTKGRAIYVIDILNGSLIKRFSVSDTGYSSMTYSIPSDVAKVDTDGNGKIDRLYVGDMGGRMWRFDIGDSNTANWRGKIVFNSNPGRDGTTGRKIFYPPDVTLEKDTTTYEMLFFGTGDREHPKEATVINRLYAVKDKNPLTTLTEQESDLLVDVTQDLLQNSSTSEADKNAIMEQLRTGNGWFIKLNSVTGEKSLSPPVVFNRVAYFTTFSPTSEGASGDPCYVGEGTARVYILEYNTGNAVFNLDLTNDAGGTVISKTDRAETVGTAIPSGVVITFIGGKAIAYIGVGGGINQPPISGKQNEQKYWKIVF
jgi:type IV pilus assembly protein PilY1